MEKKQKVYTPLFNLTLVLISLQLLYPLIHLLPSVIQIAVFLVWIMIVALNPKNSSTNEILFSKTIGIYIIFVIVLLRIVHSGNLNNGYFDPMGVAIGIFQFLLSFSLFLYIKKLDDRRKRILIKFSMICITISLLFSLYYVFFVDPQAIRNTQREFLWGVGDFQLMYAISIFSGVLYSLLRSKLKRTNRIYISVLLMLIILTLLKSNLFTSVVLAALSIVLSHLSHAKYKGLMKTGAIMILSIMLVLKDNVSLLLIKLSNWGFFHWTTQNKIIAIANLLVGGNQLDTLSSRKNLTMQSINTFKYNPLFGVNYSYYGQGVIGRHAQWADDLARHGFIGLFAMILVGYFVYINVLKSRKNELDRINVKNTWLLFIILGFLNPNMLGALLMVMFTVVPFMSVLGRDYSYEE